MLPVAPNVTGTEVTCSSINIFWTAADNRTANITIHYNSTVHSGAVDYVQDVSPLHTTMLTNLVADTQYNITVTAKYDDDSMAVSNATSARTKAGEPSMKGTVTCCIFHIRYALYYDHKYNVITTMTVSLHVRNSVYNLYVLHQHVR